MRLCLFFFLRTSAGCSVLGAEAIGSPLGFFFVTEVPEPNNDREELATPPDETEGAGCGKGELFEEVSASVSTLDEAEVKEEELVTAANREVASVF